MNGEKRKTQPVEHLSLHRLTTAKPQHDQNVTTQQFSTERTRWMNEHLPTETRAVFQDTKE